MKFEDKNGLGVVLNLEWWTFNDDEHLVVEARLVWIQAKPRIEYRENRLLKV